MELYLLDGPSRVIRGLEIAFKKEIWCLAPGTYKVKSQSGNRWYLVVHEHHKWRCECPDHTYRKVICKHIYAAALRNLPERLGFDMVELKEARSEDSKLYPPKGD